MKSPEKTIGNMIDKCSVSFIGSVDKEGFPNIRAMLKPCKRNGIEEIYFHTNTSSAKINHFKENSKSSIYICNQRFFKGLMLIGNMEIIDDKNIKDDIWEEGYEMYYPLGPTDPDYCVIKFVPQKAKYYSNFKVEEFEV